MEDVHVVTVVTVTEKPENKKSKVSPRYEPFPSFNFSPQNLMKDHSPGRVPRFRYE